ncbi:MAG: ATP-grasp domain-containing protein [Candidatus Bathyarchaeia archaeon]
MVKLTEHKGKEILRSMGINTPTGDVARTSLEARRISESLAKPVVVKAHVPFSGRFKAGVVKIAETPDEAEKAASHILSSEIRGFSIHELLVEEKVEIEKEYYAGIIINDSWKVRSPVIIFSVEGGISIEETAKHSPEKVSTLTVDVLKGVNKYDAYNLAIRLGVPSQWIPKIGETLTAMYYAFKRYEARILEINPLALTKDLKIAALDCKMVIDDSAAPRHPELGIQFPRDRETPPTQLEEMAWKIEERDYRGTSYFAQLTKETKEGGHVGFHGIGGGGAMLGMDALHRCGLKIANYADTSGNPTAAKVYRVAKIILAQPGIEGYFLSGAVIASQEQWHHAHGLVKAFRETLAEKPGFPIVALIAGNKEKEAHRIMKEGLKDLPVKLEVYGRDYVYNLGHLALRMRSLVEEYRAMKTNEPGHPI